MSEEHYFEHPNLSISWALAVRAMLAKGGVSEITPVIVSVTGFEDGVPQEHPAIRDALDQMLEERQMQSCETVANTIFPASLWNPSAPRSQLFERYNSVLPRLRKASVKNRHGLYFERLIEEEPGKYLNQLDYIITKYKERKGVRRSALQVAVFDPKRDHTTAAQVGFPCLQHVTFAPTNEGLCVNAFYATQYAFERAYGNYLGICRLGRFVAHEMGLPLIRMTCFTGILLQDDGVKVAHLTTLKNTIVPLLPFNQGFLR
jgi:hypothetical protein